MSLTTALLLAAAIVVPGCALDANCRAERSAPAVMRGMEMLDALDPTIPKMDAPLGIFPASARLDALLNEGDPRSLEAKLGLARLDQLAGRVRQAEESFLEAVQSEPGNPLPLTALGLFYASEQQWSRAAAHLGRAVELVPSDAVIRNQYAIALAQAGQTDRALGQFTQAIGEAEAHYNVGYIHWRNGQTKLAEREFRRSLALRPDLGRAKTMLDHLAAPDAPPADALHASDPVPNQPVVIQTESSGTARHAANAVWSEAE